MPGVLGMWHFACCCRGMWVTRVAWARMRKCVAALLVAGASALLIATVTTLPQAAATPPSVSADSRGQVDPATRCGPDRTAVVSGRTALSLVSICTDGRGHYEYRGVRLS